MEQKENNLDYNPFKDQAYFDMWGMLVVTLYDSIHQRWIDEIPLNERQYTLR